MTGKGTGSGSAYDASVSLGELVAAARAEEARLKSEAPQRRIEGATDKVARAKRDLDQAEDELKAALAAVKED